MIINIFNVVFQMLRKGDCQTTLAVTIKTPNACKLFTRNSGFSRVMRDFQGVLVKALRINYVFISRRTHLVFKGLDRTRLNIKGYGISSDHTSTEERKA